MRGAESMRFTDLRIDELSKRRSDEVDRMFCHEQVGVARQILPLFRTVRANIQQTTRVRHLHLKRG